MVTTAQVLTILGILSAPMISIATLVLALAALNLSLGVRRLFVKVLGFIFEYATQIKRVKEVPITPNISSDESSSTTTETSSIVKRSSLDPIELNPETPLVSESTSNDNKEITATTTVNQDQKISTTDIQFRLGKQNLSFFSLQSNLNIFRRYHRLYSTRS
jgi:hypothetical protein